MAILRLHVLFPLFLVLACRAESDTASVSEPYAAIIYDESGVPDCVESISGEAFCDGWAGSYAGNGVSWIGAPGNLGASWSWDEETFPCASSPEEALEIYDDAFHEEPEGAVVLERDRRWYEVVPVQDPSVRPGRNLVFRCDYFLELPSTSLSASSTLAWQVDPADSDLRAMVEQAQLLARRNLEANDAYTHHDIYSQGLGGAGDEWQLSLCSFNTAGLPAEDGYRHHVYEHRFEIDLARGTVYQGRRPVRSVDCAEAVGGSHFR